MKNTVNENKNKNMKFNQELIEKLRSGEIAVRNDAQCRDLDAVLYEAFKTEYILLGTNVYYFAHKNSVVGWVSSSETNLPYHSVSTFFIEQEPTKEELIAQLKEIAKKEGLKCEVVFEEVKNVEVKLISVDVTSSHYEAVDIAPNFRIINNSSPIGIKEVGEYLRNQLQNYLNENQ
jgi:hypothetical protein